MARQRRTAPHQRAVDETSSKLITCFALAKFETKDRGTVGDLGHLIENGRQSNVRAPQPGADGEQERKTIKSGISKFKMRTSIVILAVALPTH